MIGVVSIFVGMIAIVLGWPAYGADTVKVAAIYALTGEAAEANAPSIQGLRLAVDEINQLGGILEAQVELKVLDNQSTPIGSHIAAQQAADWGAVAIVGASWSSHSLPIAEVAQAQRMPMISSFSTHPGVTKVGDFIFRVCFTDNFQGAVLARFAREDLGAKTATLFVNLTSEYSLELSRIFREDFERLGGKIVCEVDYKFKQKEFDEQIKAAQAAQADILLLSGHDESGLIARLAQEAGVKSIPVGGDGWAESSFLIKGGDQLKRGYYCSHWSELVDSAPSRAFVGKYKDVPGFGVGMALAYDAGMVLAEAIARAGSTDRVRIRDALAQTKDFQGVTGNISFDAQRNPVKSAVIIEIKDGKPRYLKTLSP